MSVANDQTFVHDENSSETSSKNDCDTENSAKECTLNEIESNKVDNNDEHLTNVVVGETENFNDEIMINSATYTILKKKAMDLVEIFTSAIASCIYKETHELTTNNDTNFKKEAMELTEIYATDLATFLYGKSHELTTNNVTTFKKKAMELAKIYSTAIASCMQGYSRSNRENTTDKSVVKVEISERNVNKFFSGCSENQCTVSKSEEAHVNESENFLLKRRTEEVNCEENIKKMKLSNYNTIKVEEKTLNSKNIERKSTEVPFNSIHDNNKVQKNTEGGTSSKNETIKAVKVVENEMQNSIQPIDTTNQSTSCRFDHCDCKFNDKSKNTIGMERKSFVDQSRKNNFDINITTIESLIVECIEVEDDPEILVVEPGAREKPNTTNQTIGNIPAQPHPVAIISTTPTTIQGETQDKMTIYLFHTSTDEIIICDHLSEYFAFSQKTEEGPSSTVPEVPHRRRF